ncbi:MAG: hypothetical protein MJ248_02310 [Bacilli bacterium]|nr:hypothetical protein [Bacilli bacterium]
MKKKNKVKIIFSIVIPIVAFFKIASLIIFLVGCGIFIHNGGVVVGRTTNIEEYESYRNNVPYAKDMLPSLDDISISKEQMRFGYKNTLLFLWKSEGISLFLDCKDSYSYESTNAMSNYTFLEKEYRDQDGDYIFPVAQFEHKGYTFHIAPNYNYSKRLTPKSFLMIGLNDEKNKMCYLYFYDSDLDYILSNSDSKGREQEMKNFVNEYFIWFE